MWVALEFPEILNNMGWHFLKTGSSSNEEVLKISWALFYTVFFNLRIIYKENFETQKSDESGVVFFLLQNER